MRLIQKYLPDPRHTEIHRIFVKAKPDVAWNTVRHLDMGKVPLVRLLFDIRTLPDKLMGKSKEDDRRALGVDQITESGNGFFIAEEIPGREVVVASAGKFWHLSIPFAKVTPEEFIILDTPGYGKLAWNISVEPFNDGSTVAVELRTTATDEVSWKKLNRYYHIIGVGSQFMRRSMMHHIETVLGKLKRPDDDDRRLTGDELLQHCKHKLTYSEDIEAPPSIVWSYLMQLGCDRGGWYSIDALDNGGKKSVDHLVNGWTTRNAGDKLWATSKPDGFFDVYLVEKEKAFVIGGESRKLQNPFKMTWAFVIEPIGNDATHLITRVRMEAEPKLSEWLIGNLLAPPVHTIMQKMQLKNLKTICERDAQRRKNYIEA